MNTNLSFEQPAVLFLLFAVIPLVFLRYFWRNRGGILIFSFNNWRGQGIYNSPSIQGMLYVLSQISFWIALIILIIALAEPYRIEKERIHISRGIDIMLIIDVSPSMAAQDSSGKSRLDVTKETIHQFIDRRRNDPIGLVAFGTQAALRVPPTITYDFLSNAVDELQVLELGEGTAIGTGIALSSLHLQNSTASEQIMILFTDGESNSDEIAPDSAAQIAAELGIRLYVLDIGSDQELLIEFVDPETGIPYRALYSGQKRGVALQGLASITGGKYYTVSNAQTLQNILITIDGLEQVETRLKTSVKKTSVHRQLILAALIIVLIDFVIKKFILQEIL